MRALQRTARRDWPAFLALRWLGIWIITGLLHPLLSADLTRDVTTLGVSPDGMTLNTQALQRAIDSVSGDGGGILRFPPGHYRCGSILLKDCVTLQLDCGAVLQGSCDIADYRVLEPFLDGTGAQMGYCFIGAVDAKHIGIIGTGLIDGRGAAVLASRAAGERGQRPFLVRLVRCTGVTIENVALTGAAAWTVNLFQCADVICSRVAISCHGLANNDGIDIDSSRRVHITDCSVDTQDDALCLKTTSRMPCHDITVTGCTLCSDCAAIKIGSESVGDVTSIAISACHIVRAGLGGIKLCSVDGARINGVSISAITIDDAAVAIFLRLGARLATFHGGDRPRSVGAMHDITLRNITAITGNPGIVISGIPDHPIAGISLINITLTSPGGTVASSPPAAPVKEAVAAYPEVNMFGTVPASAVFGRHIANLTIDGLVCALAHADGLPAMVGLDIAHFGHHGWHRILAGQEQPDFPEADDIAIDQADPHWPRP